MADIRRFTREDWYAWQGAEQFDNGTEPFIFDKEFGERVGDEELTVIASKLGLAFSLYIDADEIFAVWEKNEEINWTEEEARAEIERVAGIVDEYKTAAEFYMDISLRGRFPGFEKLC